MAETIRLDTCTSTMDEARQLARDGADDGTTVIAAVMEGGRGQHGNTWHAPEGGLYLSRVLRGLDDPHLLTLALGNAVADALEIAGADGTVKWVNDVMIGERKVAGILVEGESTGDALDFLVAGVGVNLNGQTNGWPADLGSIATTLETELEAEVCVEDFETVLLSSLDTWVDAVRGGREQDILAAWRARDHLRGKAVQVGDVSGTAEGIDDDGHLLVDGQAIQSGSVTLTG